jgi:hypothetical protein
MQPNGRAFTQRSWSRIDQQRNLKGNIRRLIVEKALPHFRCRWLEFERWNFPTKESENRRRFEWTPST